MDQIQSHVPAVVLSILKSVLVSRYFIAKTCVFKTILFPDCMIILWKLNSSTEVTYETFLETDDVQNKESWTFYKALRCTNIVILKF